MSELQVWPLLGGVGAVLAVPSGGALLARVIYRRRYLALEYTDRSALALSIGLAATTIWLSVLAHVGAFQPALVGAPGLILAGILVARVVVGRARTPDRQRRTGNRGPLWPGLVVAMLVSLPALYLPGVDEPLGVGRDQQLYANFGLKLARDGRFQTRLQAADSGDDALLDGAFRKRGQDAHIIPGTIALEEPRSRTLVPYLPSGVAVWVAVFAWIGGDFAAFATNAFVWPVALWLAFVLARRRLGDATASVACAILALLPTTLWTAGLTLNEPVAFALACSLAVSLAHARSRIALSGPLLCLVAAAMIRLDALVLGIALILAFAVCDWARGIGQRPRDQARDAAAVIALATAVVFGFYALWYRPYLEFNHTQALVALAGLALAVLLASFGHLVGRPMFATPRTRRHVVGGATALLVLAFCYAALVRPYVEPYAIIGGETGLAGTRDFREESLRNLAAYVSWPGLVLALGGLVAALDVLRKRSVTVHGTFVTICFLVTATLFVANPQISPDHPFAIRRFVPIVIPCVVMFACYAVVRLLGLVPGQRAFPAAPVVAILFAPFLLLQPWKIPLLPEASGLSRQIASLANSLPSGIIVADHDLASFTPDFSLIHGRPVIPLSFVHHERSALVRAWVDARRASGTSAPVLHGLGQLPANADPDDDFRMFEIAPTRVVPTVSPPARETRVERTLLQLTQIRVRPPDPGRMFGGVSLWGAEEDGFLRPEVAPFGTFRWTTGTATIAMPLVPGTQFDRMKIDLFALERPDRRTRVEVRLNGRLVLADALDGGISTRIVAAAVDSSEERMVLRISSDTVTPKSLGIGLAEQELGVGVIGIRFLQTGEPTSHTAVGMDGFKYLMSSHALTRSIKVQPSQTEVSIPLTVANVGSRPWATLRESGRIEGAIQIGARWYRRGDRSTPVSDQRWTLETGLLPGDRTTVVARFQPVDFSGRRLVPGEYDLRVGLVREALAWMPEPPAGSIVHPIQVE